MSAFQIGLVGLGKIATNHLQAIQSLPTDFALTAVCDKQVAQRDAFREKHDIPSYASLEELLAEQPTLDVMALCSPSGLHAEQTIAIATAGKHVITEKPMALTLEDGVNMVTACEKNKVHLFVVKQVRFEPVYQLLKDAIHANRFGKIYLANLNVFWTRPQSYYDEAPWRGTKAFDGGMLMNQVSHHVDLLQWLLGPLASVQAMMTTAARKIETEDTAILNLRWQSGALSSLNATILTYPNNLETSLTILGENGTVKIGGKAGKQLTHWEFASAHEQDTQAKTLMEAGSPTILGHQSYYQNVADVLRGKALPHTNGREGLRSLEVLTAAYRSAHDHKTVTLPLTH